jgi:TetR/AcrR family transcriptional repressor of nem operon
MAGVKQFDDQAVLDRAADLFWRQGFEATSILDLETATGLGRGSLYNAFGDKEAMFLKAMDRYGQTKSPPFHFLDEPDVLTGLRLLLRTQVANMSEPRRPRGCLVTNTCLAVGGEGTGAVEARVGRGLRGIEAKLKTAFVRASEQGQITPDADPDRLARFYCAILQSLAVMHKGLGDRATLEDVIEVALSAWPGSATAPTAPLAST